ncbi:MAG TPA: Ig-like domain-containing protein, partial [Anaerolineae bacterium]|nr:Ig-like domain-containing protein [Anaerolineae bacterium]
MKTYRYWLFRIFCVGLLGVLFINQLYAENEIPSRDVRPSYTQSGVLGQKINLTKPHLSNQNPLIHKGTPNIIGKSARVLLNQQKNADNAIIRHHVDINPRRDDPFGDWISYDDGNPVWLRLIENTWSRVIFTSEFQFTLQGIQFMPHNPGPNDNAPCRVLVYSEDQETHDLVDVLWETEIESLEEWSTDDIDDNWHFVEIPEDDWIVFDEGEHFSILYGPAPAGEYTGLERFDIVDDFENYDLDEPPNGEGWAYAEEGRSWVGISDEEAHSPDQSVRFHDPRDEEGDYCILQFDHDAVEHGKLEFWLNLSDDGYFGFRAYSGDNRDFFIQFNNDNRISVNDGDENVWAGGRWPDDEWFLIEIQYDTDDGIFSVWLDGDEIVGENDLATGDPVDRLWWLCFNDAVIDDAWLDDLKINLDTEADVPYGWWNLYDDETEVERSFVYAGDEIELGHDGWDGLDGDLLLRANGEYPEQEPDIHLSRNAINFGNVLVDHQSNRTFTITNRGREDLIVSDIRVEGEYFNTDFRREFVLEPNAGQDITVTFAPEEEGDFEGTVTIASNDPDEDEVTVDLSGSGVIDDVDRHGVELLGRIEGEWEEVNDVDIQDEFAFLAVGNDGIAVVDVSEPESMEIVGTCDTPGEAMGIRVVGDYAYVADYNEGLRVIDITDPEHPEEVGSCDTPGRAHSIDVWGNYAFIADGSAGVRKINISNPEEPQEERSMDTPGDARDVIIQNDNYGYIADYNSGVRQFYTPNMSAGRASETNHLAYAVKLRGDYVYVADGNAGIVIFDLNLIREEGSFNTEGSALDLTVFGRYVFVADGDNGLRVIDFSDLEEPAEIGYYDTPGEARRLAVDDNIVYLADGNNFSVYDCDRAINNLAPEWIDVPGDRINVNEGNLLEFDIRADDPNDDRLTLEMHSEDLPDEAEFTDNRDGTGDFHWETNFEDEGSYDVTFIVSDGDFEVETEVEIIVNNVNRTPEIDRPGNGNQVDQGPYDENQQITINFHANDADGDNMTWRISDRGNLPGGESMTAGGVFTWTPNYQQAGAYHFSGEVSDGNGGTDAIRVDFTVRNVNRRPNPAIIVDLTLREDAVRINIADLDTIFIDPDSDDLDFSIAEGAEELRLNINGSGVLSLQPITDFCFDEPGLTVTISAEDPEGLTAETSFQVVVAPVNDPPEPFNMLTPEDNHEVHYVPDSLGTLDFTWQVAEQNDYEIDLVDY